MNNKVVLKKKELALAISVAMFGGLMTGCSSDDGGAVGGNKTLNTSGGNGGIDATAFGGDSGYVDLYLDGGTGGVIVKRAGTAKTSFTSQKNQIKPSYGVNPMEVTSDTTIAVATLYTSVADGGGTTASTNYVGTDGVLRTAVGVNADYAGDAEVTDGTLYRWDTNPNELYTAVGNDTTADLAAAGTVYFRVNNANAWTADADDTTDDFRVTGVKVAKGATLTLENAINGGTLAQLNMMNDLLNEGTITTADANATDRGDLHLRPSSIINTGTIDTSGSGTVVNGGFVDVNVDYSAISSGPIMTSGADNAAGAGGNAGNLNFESGYYTENTGDLTANGGSGSTGNNGGNGGNVDIYSTYSAVRNSGDISATGGNGDAGGNGGDVWVGNYADAGTLNSGDINTSGGSGSVTWGGDAGTVDIYAYGGLLASSGAITTMGGDAAVNNDAGAGGDVYLYSANGFASWDYGTTPRGDIEISGDINTAGGNTSGTGNGGNGGNFELDTDKGGNGNEDTSEDQGIYMLGYSTIDTTGGDGQFPGDGGNIAMYAAYGWDGSNYNYSSIGPVENQADLIASAGTFTGTENTGTEYAYAGDINLETSYYYGDINPKAMVTNSGDITSNASAALNRSGTWSAWDAGGGEVWMWGFNGVNNSGNITLNGGDDTAADGGTDGVGSHSGYVELYAELGTVVNSGAIEVNGGDGEYEAGNGSGWTAFYGPEVRNSGKITGSGGDFNETLGGAPEYWDSYRAGYGGWVWMMGTKPSDVSNSGAISLTPGASYADWWALDPANRNPNGYYIVIGAHCEGDC